MGGKGFAFVACLSHLTIAHASLSRRSTVPAPNRGASNIWAFITLCGIFYIRENIVSYLLPVRPSV